MRSGNGRHRRPRQAPALVVAAGVTGSAIAIPLLGATGASAADASTWDRVAECESGGMWSADLGNGYYGGLQISQETWVDFGGTAYAPTADQASRSQQIAVAEKILAAQGPSAWPTCALVTGLTADADAKADAGADSADGEGRDAGADTAPDSEPADESAEPEPETSEEAVLPPAPESTPSSGQFGRDSASDAGESNTEPSTEASAQPSTAATGKGKHRGEAAPEPSEPAAADAEPGKADDERESGRHASRGDSSARGDAAADGSYTVRAGDNLWAIADELKVDGGWPALYQANREVVGSDADLIVPGQTLDLTAKQG
ncbi:peptidoglycan-binding protein LysM [Streptomyces camponoticapitis]|uniref:Peptidoglycan-binding protein LysM n=1 Tax=Streptomyces camponoticapitis TaxID=1616125 RepID=A0ABQ2EIL7_9ACTN|nr:transglycosylase family protein [Streptomyces camponoticapitis]GGK09710.1 peptidoglycan-binding protein LysM [Streptomyces camponoticapitis]